MSTKRKSIVEYKRLYEPKDERINELARDGWRITLIMEVRCPPQFTVYKELVLMEREVTT